MQGQEDSLPLLHPPHPSEEGAGQARPLPGQFAQADVLQGQEQPLLMQKSGSEPAILSFGLSNIKPWDPI